MLLLSSAAKADVILMRSKFFERFIATADDFVSQQDSSDYLTKATQITKQLFCLDFAINLYSKGGVNMSSIDLVILGMVSGKPQSAYDTAE